MQLIINCPKCGKPLSIPLPDHTTETEAARIAQDVRCADCLRAMPSAEQSAPRGEHDGTVGNVASHQAESSALSLDTPREVVGNR